ncbi:phage head-tail connector protein [Fructilactobacillus sp. Tb1]|uniref:phage head-tail connector protein n=1 Tax=Fructilactobacillus sp. Tb1 TaxID=3422304 RepID=UPI003D273EA6
MEDYLNDVKIMLGLKKDDQDELLKLIIKNTTASLKVKLALNNDNNIPDSLGYIVTEVSIRRFNRLNNEGMSNYSQEGESITYQSSDFDDFAADIEDYKTQNDIASKSLGTLQALNPYE